MKLKLIGFVERLNNVCDKYELHHFSFTTKKRTSEIAEIILIILLGTKNGEILRGPPFKKL